MGIVSFFQLRAWIYRPQLIESEINVIIPKGSGSSTVSQYLKDAGVIDKAWLFKLATKVFDREKSLKAGEYAFSGEVSIYDVMNKIASGDILYHRLTLPEGLTTVQFLQLIDTNPFLGGEITLMPKEGELLPETYSFVRGDPKDNIIKQAKEAMERTLEAAWQNRDETLPLKDKRELLILASIIEKETGIDSERTLASSVFVNRLRKGMKLQTDPTVIYALTQGKRELGRSLTRKDLEVENPYNTYKYYGLPPAPICNPGKASIEAAAHPEISSYLYFVASGKGGHNFAVTLDEHNANVQNWKNGKK